MVAYRRNFTGRQVPKEDGSFFLRKNALLRQKNGKAGWQFPWKFSTWIQCGFISTSQQHAPVFIFFTWASHWFDSTEPFYLPFSYINIWRNHRSVKVIYWLATCGDWPAAALTRLGLNKSEYGALFTSRPQYSWSQQADLFFFLIRFAIIYQQYYSCICHALSHHHHLGLSCFNIAVIIAIVLILMLFRDCIWASFLSTSPNHEPHHVPREVEYEFIREPHCTHSPWEPAVEKRAHS